MTQEGKSERGGLGFGAMHEERKARNSSEQKNSPDNSVEKNTPAEVEEKPQTEGSEKSGLGFGAVNNERKNGKTESGAEGSHSGQVDKIEKSSTAPTAGGDGVTPPKPAPEKQPVSHPLWQLMSEKEPSKPEHKKVLDVRKKWLEVAFSARGDMKELGVFRGALARRMRETITKARTPGANTMLGRRLKDPATSQQAQFFLIMFEEGSSLGQLFDEAKTFKELTALKVMGAALLEPFVTKDGRKPWQLMDERQKRVTRLGELIGLEVERRQIILTMQGPKPMEPDVAERAYTRYRDFAGSVDIPDKFRENFKNVAEEIYKRYPEIKHNEELKKWGNTISEANTYYEEKKVVSKEMDEWDKTIMEAQAYHNEKQSAVNATKKEALKQDAFWNMVAEADVEAKAKEPQIPVPKERHKKTVRVIDKLEKFIIKKPNASLNNLRVFYRKLYKELEVDAKDVGMKVADYWSEMKKEVEEKKNKAA